MNLALSVRAKLFISYVEPFLSLICFFIPVKALFYISQLHSLYCLLFNSSILPARDNSIHISPSFCYVRFTVLLLVLPVSSSVVVCCITGVSSSCPSPLSSYDIFFPCCIPPSSLSAPSCCGISQFCD